MMLGINSSLAKLEPTIRRKEKVEPKYEEMFVECESCMGTGLMGADTETKRAFICFVCKGTGKEKFTYLPFKKREVVEGIETVVARGFGMPYSEFLEKY